MSAGDARLTDAARNLAHVLGGGARSSAESRRELGDGADDCVSSAAIVSMTLGSDAYSGEGALAIASATLLVATSRYDARDPAVTRFAPRSGIPAFSA